MTDAVTKPRSTNTPKSGFDQRRTEPGAPDECRASEVFLEPVTTAIVAALSSGGTLVLKAAATEAVKDAYAAAKVWIHDRYPGASVSFDQLEQQPASKACQEVVAEDLEREGASTDTQLVKLAQTVLAGCGKSRVFAMRQSCQRV
jgi:hypothetical protein